MLLKNVLSLALVNQIKNKNCLFRIKCFLKKLLQLMDVNNYFVCRFLILHVNN